MPIKLIYGIFIIGMTRHRVAVRLCHAVLSWSLLGRRWRQRKCTAFWEWRPTDGGHISLRLAGFQYTCTAAKYLPMEATQLFRFATVFCATRLIVWRCRRLSAVSVRGGVQWSVARNFDRLSNVSPFSWARTNSSDSGPGESLLFKPTIIVALNLCLIARIRNNDYIYGINSLLRASMTEWLRDLDAWLFWSSNFRHDTIVGLVSIEANQRSWYSFHSQYQIHLEFRFRWGSTLQATCVSLYKAASHSSNCHFCFIIIMIQIWRYEWIPSLFCVVVTTGKARGTSATPTSSRDWPTASSDRETQAGSAGVSWREASGRWSCTTAASKRGSRTSPCGRPTPPRAASRPAQCCNSSGTPCVNTLAAIQEGTA